MTDMTGTANAVTNGKSSAFKKVRLEADQNKEEIQTAADPFLLFGSHF